MYIREIGLASGPSLPMPKTDYPERCSDQSAYEWCVVDEESSSETKNVHVGILVTPLGREIRHRGKAEILTAERKFRHKGQLAY